MALRGSTNVIVWFTTESFDDVNKAIDREKQLKRWNRTKKEWLIAQRNPTWEDLAAEWYVKHQFEPDTVTQKLPIENEK